MAASEEEALVTRIHRAFAGVGLEGGISLIEAEYADGGQIAPEHLVDQQEKSDWTTLVDNRLCDFTVTFCFTDYKGFRFYIAPYMVWTLRNFRHSDSIIADGTIYAIDPDLYIFDDHPFEGVFTDLQIDCMRDFLAFATRQENDLDAVVAGRRLQRLNRLLERNNGTEPQRDAADREPGRSLK